MPRVSQAGAINKPPATPRHAAPPGAHLTLAGERSLGATVRPPLYANVPVSPHPKPAQQTIAELDDRVLADLVTIIAGDVIPPEKRSLAGAPDLKELEAELQRRESAGQAVAR